MTKTPGKITKTKFVDEIVISKEMKEECLDEIKVKTEPNLLENVRFAGLLIFYGTKELYF